MSASENQIFVENINCATKEIQGSDPQQHKSKMEDGTAKNKTVLTYAVFDRATDRTNDGRIIPLFKWGGSSASGAPRAPCPPDAPELYEQM
ncbi:hypothetical protein GWI33_006274 [Rhynchophorus ferrugineus]|uniref:Uncharacterized protein n=1 Tax=Rhynchophorus ferrugineus TaxID=354439 RepID=A0A834MFL4_RHYFE|nr:hypothetical protein GWI33_006274 [Rhynchophorus ferrugineus]